MNAYTLESAANDFQAYLTEKSAEEEELIEVYGRPVAHEWHSVRMVPERESRRRPYPLGDCPCIFLGTVTPALSQRAVDVLRDLLEPVGEFLPLECDIQPLWIYNCTRFADVLDIPASDIKRFDSGGIMHINRHVWRPEVERETAFRIPQPHRSFVYITDRVVERIRSAGLRGFDLSRP